MTSDQVVTVIVAVIAAVGAAFVTGILARPKTNAEARSADATGQALLSGDAREWARDFANQAKSAAERADRAEQRADRSEKRCDEIEHKMDLLVDYTRLLQREVSQATGHPAPAPPPELIPPL